MNRSLALLLFGIIVSAALIDLAECTVGGNSFGSLWHKRNQKKLHQKRDEQRWKEAAKNGVAAPTELWFTQELDHFNGQNQATWHQRYYVNASFWNPDFPGPIFVQVGGEGDLSPSSVTSYEMSVYAQQFSALQFGLEHRFYGKSQPFPDLSTQNLVYLSSEQALADLANFIVAMQGQFNAQNSPVVVFGGSYPANLAAWFRMKYPNIAIGAVASSAPVQAVLDFYQYLDVVDLSLSYVTGLECDYRISLATTQMEQMLGSESGTQQLEQMFNLCQPLKSQQDIETFMSDTMGNFMETVQYDNEGLPVNIETMCGMMNNGSDSDALANYAAISNMWLEIYDETCLDASYQDYVDLLLNLTMFSDGGVGARQWTYQTCIEFGYFQTTDSINQPFGTLVPLSYYTDMCTDVFGFKFLPRINETNWTYGSKKPYGSSNIAFVNGSLDPWHALSITADFSDTVQAILIQGTAHCADFYPATPSDPPGLAAAQEEIPQLIGQWLMSAN